MSDDPTITKQLLAAIASAGVRSKVSLIIELCVDAVTHLDSLDHVIYQQAVAATKEYARIPTKKDLEQLATNVLGGVRGLSAYLASCDLAEAEADDEDGFDDLEFDLGGDPAPSKPDEVSLDDVDIDSVLDGLAPTSTDKRSNDERWAEVREALTSYSYALASQLDEFDQRFGAAVEREQITQALRELDDTGSGLVDGVFALMSTICESYLETFDRDQMIPGHHDALTKALRVRRAVADLRQEVKALNERVQDPAAGEEQRRSSIDEIAGVLTRFIAGDSWAVMRSADRLELQSFAEQIAVGAFKAAVPRCEGLDKYLDSLLSVNQREVLIRHDRELMGEIASILEGVGPIVDISPHGAAQMVRQAFEKAEALHGYLAPLDALLARWRGTVTEESSPQEIVELGTGLAELATAVAG